MAFDYYNLATDNQQGEALISLESIKNIATITAAKLKGVYPAKKENDMIQVKRKDDRLLITAMIRLQQDIEIANVCSLLQKNIYKNVMDMTGIKCDSIAIDITGFIKDKE